MGDMRKAEERGMCKRLYVMKGSIIETPNVGNRSHANDKPEESSEAVTCQ